MLIFKIFHPISTPQRTSIQSLEGWLGWGSISAKTCTLGWGQKWIILQWCSCEISTIFHLSTLCHVFFFYFCIIFVFQMVGPLHSDLHCFLSFWDLRQTRQLLPWWKLLFLHLRWTRGQLMSIGWNLSELLNGFVQRPKRESDCSRNV